MWDTTRCAGVSEGLAEAREDNASIVVLSGRPHGFSDSGSAATSGRVGGDAILPTVEAQRRLVTTLAELPALTVTILDGEVSGFGFALALAADIRIASDHAVFRLGTYGLPPALSWLLGRCVPAGVAASLLYGVRELGADRALEVGLVSEVLSGEQASGHVREFASRLGPDALPWLAARRRAWRNQYHFATLSEAARYDIHLAVVASESL